MDPFYPANSSSSPNGLVGAQRLVGMRIVQVLHGACTSFSGVLGTWSKTKNKPHPIPMRSLYTNRKHKEHLLCMELFLFLFNVMFKSCYVFSYKWFIVGPHRLVEQTRNPRNKTNFKKKKKTENHSTIVVSKNPYFETAKVSLFNKKKIQPPHHPNPKGPNPQSDLHLRKAKKQHLQQNQATYIADGLRQALSRSFHLLEGSFGHLSTRPVAVDLGKWLFLYLIF